MRGRLSGWSKKASSRTGRESPQNASKTFSTKLLPAALNSTSWSIFFNQIGPVNRHRVSRRIEGGKVRPELGGVRNGFMRQCLPARDQVSPDTPLRLSVAAALAFPDGSMTASGLRREGARGKLVIERIAGKDYTTLGDIERMRKQCRVEAKVPDCGSESAAVVNQSGSSETEITKRARAALHTMLSERN
jgi:hypothetical protein